MGTLLAAEEREQKVVKLWHGSFISLHLVWLKMIMGCSDCVIWHRAIRLWVRRVHIFSILQLLLRNFKYNFTGKSNSCIRRKNAILKNSVMQVFQLLMPFENTKLKVSNYFSGYIQSDAFGWTVCFSDVVLSFHMINIIFLNTL